MEAARAETPPAAEGCCYHCSLPVDPAEEIHAEIEGEPRGFCCIGCKSVCEAIYAAGLQGFYQRTPEGTPLAPPPELPRELALYDLDEVQEEFVASLGDVRDIHLLVEGIHCAACVWLIENTLRSMPGVELARVNLSGRRLRVQWDNGRLRLSAIIQRLGRIGYAAVPYDPEAAEGSLKRENRHLLYRMAFAGFSMMNLLWISIALYSGADQGEFKGLFHWVGFCLATPTLIYSGQPFFKGAWSGIRNLHLGMDVPIAVGASITYLYSVYVTVSATAVGEVYYDTVVNFLFVILVGRYLEAISKRQAVASTQRLLDLQPRVATVLRDGEERIVPIRSVKSGEVVLVRPGERIPVDGVVLEGSSVIDEAMLTGESEPVVKGLGAQVSAGTINGHGVLKVEVRGLLRDTALGRIIRLVEEAQASKAPIQCVADRIVPWFVAVTLTLATLTFLYWVNSDFELALMAATAVLIITCPCAFGLATPMSIAVASGLGARHGILVKNGEVLETLSSINHVVFDKTGTLTEGRMSLTSVRTASGQWRRGEGRAGAEITDLIGRLAAVERYSEHPVASAILDLADEWKLERVPVEEFENHPGYGVRARLGGIEIAAGNRAWMKGLGVALNPEFETVQEGLDRQGIGSLHLAWDGVEVALLGLEDRIREGALPLIEALKADGMQLTLLSGDRQGTAEAIARRLGGMEVIAEVMPEDKDRVIARLQAGSHKVAMVGDGVNDAPALVRADIGIALGSGTDVSIASADIVLMSSELRKVRLAVALSRRTLRTIRQNIGISITYNVIMVPLAMATFVTPLVAAVSMPVSSLLVIGNAARIRTLFRKQS
ncbi:MAG: copper-translocating P-type ATPase [Candidatus Sedimenticola endophacoides]|uniref:Copper-translocating P-type ATPase n=1 Tax=Candidatus Sedimenticola endophacoides TaxID=2548426 RepID=A0A6N4DPP6_9GAMM|nr:MAG: copper-translocating P-type ATPase [Candidatus Sedimenticola endophacoides]OQX35144.1 MAG: copper-translocating P-type ATPase [Candidatus Sedimenticola endophacoides]OQX40645.1 MAG: copper-translocating P-type ATPase [Candidatus Sedimenticola endophacoides]PUD98452.1 MAG: copper-translocating P-type ATPase [Candidatus Sedimenticola endophacoides]PUD99752.1 MAG: copper-translocating P-type ATPase [Candidatus Sedimenticola endophacoides]